MYNRAASIAPNEFHSTHEMYSEAHFAAASQSNCSICTGLFCRSMLYCVMLFNLFAHILINCFLPPTARFFRQHCRQHCRQRRRCHNLPPAISSPHTPTRVNCFTLGTRQTKRVPSCLYTFPFAWAGNRLIASFIVRWFNAKTKRSSLLCARFGPFVRRRRAQ